MEESDHSKDFDYMEETTPIFRIEMINFNYEHPPTTNFYNLYRPLLLITRGLV